MILQVMNKIPPKFQEDTPIKTLKIVTLMIIKGLLRTIKGIITLIIKNCPFISIQKFYLKNEDNLSYVFYSVKNPNKDRSHKEGKHSHQCVIIYKLKRILTKVLDNAKPY